MANFMKFHEVFPRRVLSMVEIDCLLPPVNHTKDLSHPVFCKLKIFAEKSWVNLAEINAHFDLQICKSDNIVHGRWKLSPSFGRQKHIPRNLCYVIGRV